MQYATCLDDGAVLKVELVGDRPRTPPVMRCPACGATFTLGPRGVVRADDSGPPAQD